MCWLLAYGTSFVHDLKKHNSAATTMDEFKLIIGQVSGRVTSMVKKIDEIYDKVANWGKMNENQKQDIIKQILGLGKSAERVMGSSLLCRVYNPQAQGEMLGLGVGFRLLSVQGDWCEEVVKDVMVNEGMSKLSDMCALAGAMAVKAVTFDFLHAVLVHLYEREAASKAQDSNILKLYFRSHSHSAFSFSFSFSLIQISFSLIQILIDFHFQSHTVCRIVYKVASSPLCSFTCTRPSYYMEMKKDYAVWQAANLQQALANPLNLNLNANQPPAAKRRRSVMGSVAVNNQQLGLGDAPKAPAPVRRSVVRSAKGVGKGALGGKPAGGEPGP